MEERQSNGVKSNQNNKRKLASQFYGARSWESVHYERKKGNIKGHHKENRLFSVAGCVYLRWCMIVIATSIALCCAQNECVWNDNISLSLCDVCFIYIVFGC